MSDDFETLMTHRPVAADRPLRGLTVLVVEDSRFASEALRLLCLRSGARIRRADCLRSARRHLQVYRPQVVVVDLGLPDGNGEALIAELAQAAPRVEVILASSGDDGAEERAMAAGADGFLAKPVASVAMFQQAVLSRLPEGALDAGPRAVPDDEVRPDPFAFRDDMLHAAEVLAASDGAGRLDYLAQFLGTVARSARDRPLERAAHGLARHRQSGHDADASLTRIASLVDARIAATGPV